MRTQIVDLLSFVDEEDEDNLYSKNPEQENNDNSSKEEVTKYVRSDEYLPNLYKGDLILRKTHKDLTELPDPFTVEGDLDLSKSKIVRLPEKLTVHGSLNLKDSKVMGIPNSVTLTVHENFIAGKHLSSLPERLRVDGILFLKGNKYIKRIPNYCKFGNTPVLTGSNVREIGRQVSVEGDLNLLRTKVVSVGSGLKVTGAFTFNVSKVKKVPANINVGVYNPKGVNLLWDMSIPDWAFSACTKDLSKKKVTVFIEK